MVIASVARRLLERPAEGELSISLGRGRFRLLEHGWGVASGVGGRCELGREWPWAGAKVVVERSVPALCGVNGMLSVLMACWAASLVPEEGSMAVSLKHCPSG